VTLLITRPSDNQQRTFLTPDDKEFTKEELLAALENFNPSKATGEDGLKCKILLQIFKIFPTFFTETYNQRLKKEHFPKL
jgi:hypothetical protein